MYSIMEPIKNWFGFTRRERRSSFILLLLIIVILGARYAVPESTIKINDMTDADFSDLVKSDSISEKLSYASLPVSVKKSRPQQSYKRYGSNKPLIDINKSDSAALVELPGIGPVLSARIIKYRHLLGGFATIGQLKEVYGLPQETFDIIKGKVFADSMFITRININSAGFKELSRLPYFERYDVTAILKYRELKGKINTITELIENNLITKEKAIKLRPYLKFEE
jgi:competence protein ComEA